MNSSPNISVIIPVFNGEEYIEEALNSVFAQSFRDFEVIVVNDGSTDGTGRLLEQFSGKIKCLTQENKGLVAARARGIEDARGQWIAFLDADDIWLPNKLERQVSEATGHPECGIIASDFLSFEGTTVVCRSVKQLYSPRNGHICQELLFGNWITPSAAMIRRGCFHKVQTFDLPRPAFGEDWLMWMQITPYYPVRFIDEVLVRRRIHSNNMSRVDEEGQFRALLRNFELVNKLVPEIGNRPELTRRALSSICINRGKRNLMESKVTLARDKFRRAISYKPYSISGWVYLALSSTPGPLLRRAATVSKERDRVRALYELVLPARVRDWIHRARHPERRFEEKIARICRRGVEDFLEDVARQHPLKGRILEIGAGARYENRRRFGSDAVLYCRSDIIRWPQSTIDLIADCTNLAFRTGSIDAAICSEVLEHVPKLELALTELARVLRSGGYLIVTMPFFYPLHGVDRNGHGDYWRLTPRNLKDIAEEHFEIVEERFTHLFTSNDPFVVNQQLLLRRK
jgi:glycosyltransferase involved in cell wall biosynthesis